GIFLRAPTQFEPAQTLLDGRGATESQFLHSLLRELPNSFPHHQVAAPELLITFIGSAELIDRLLLKQEEHGCGYGPVAVAGERDKAQATVEDVPVNVLEKGKGLRRQAVTTSRPAMQGIEGFDRLKRGAGFDSNTATFALPDGPSHGSL